MPCPTRRRQPFLARCLSLRSRVASRNVCRNDHDCRPHACRGERLPQRVVRSNRFHILKAVVRLIWCFRLTSATAASNFPPALATGHTRTYRVRRLDRTYKIDADAKREDIVGWYADHGGRSAIAPPPAGRSFPTRPKPYDILQNSLGGTHQRARLVHRHRCRS
jgi:hypothetical protein